MSEIHAIASGLQRIVAAQDKQIEKMWFTFAKIVRELGPSMSPGSLADVIERKAIKLQKK